MKRSWMIAVFLVVLVLDQITKLAIVERFSLGETLEIIPSFFNLTLAYNKGAAFGIFAGLPEGTRELVLLGTTVLAFVVIGYFMKTQPATAKWARLGFVLVLSGAVGNIIDRVRLGYVIDFLDFYIGSYHWPAFNVADSAICIGVVILVLMPQGSPKEASQEPA